MQNTLRQKIAKYGHIARLGWLEAIEYRTDFFMSVFGWGIRLAIAAFLWKAVSVQTGGNIGAYTFSSIMAYFFLIQVISSFVFSAVGFNIAQDIYKGDFSQYLLKPVSYLSFRLLYELSRNIFRTIIGATIFGSIIFFAFGGISLSFEKIPFIFLALLGGYFINFFLICSVALSAFWIDNSHRIIFIYFGMLTIFSGMTVPLNLFPPSLLAIISKLPFGYIFFYPAHVLQSPRVTDFFYTGLLYQWIYVVILGALTYFIYRRGIKRFEGVGI